MLLEEKIAKEIKDDPLQNRGVRRPAAAREPRAGAAPSITPPVSTVVLPPSYGVTSFLDVSMKTRGARALRPELEVELERLLLLLLLVAEASEEREAQDETEASSEMNDGAALTTLERLDERECIDGRRGTRSWP